MPYVSEEYEKLLHLVERLDGTISPDGSVHNIGPAHNVLAALIKYDTSSSVDPKICKSTVELAKALQYCFQSCGFDVEYAEDIFPPGSDTKQAALVARIANNSHENQAAQGEYGKIKGGVLLSGHMDVIPAPKTEYLKWQPSRNPFVLGDEYDRMVGRGTSDMKSFIYNMLAIAEFYKDKKHLLDKPVYMALSWGEELGCKGTDTVIRLLSKMKADPELVIVGEPTYGALITGHKGASNINVSINASVLAMPPLEVYKGLEISLKSAGGHSSTPDRYINANRYINMVIEGLRQVREKYGTEGVDISLTKMEVGPSPNSIPSHAILGVRVGAADPELSRTLLNEINLVTEEVEKQLKNDTEAQRKKTGDGSFDHNKSNVTIVSTSKYASAPDATLAITRAGKMYLKLQELQDKYKKEYANASNGFEPPYPIINVGVVNNESSYPGNIELGIHIRPTSRQESEKITDEIKAVAAEIESDLKNTTGRATVTCRKISETIPLPSQATSKHKQQILEKLGAEHEKIGGRKLSPELISYATEAGGISEGLARINGTAGTKDEATVVVYGPGDINRAHRPNEYITKSELARSLQFPLMAIWEFCVDPQKKLNSAPGTVIIPAEPVKQIEQAQRKTR